MIIGVNEHISWGDGGERREDAGEIRFHFQPTWRKEKQIFFKEQ